MRRRVVAILAVLSLAVMAGAIAFLYQPFVSGSAISRDGNLLISSESMLPGGGDEVLVYTYRYQVDTSYYTLFSMRNEGPLSVTVLGLDTEKVAALTPFLGPAELLVGSTNPAHDMVAWASAAPLDKAVVEPGAELWLWIRWEIGPCGPEGTLPLSPGSGIGPPPWIPLRWSILGIPRTSNIDLGYEVMFQLPDDVARVCTTPTARFAKQPGP